jgi:hypothetical protein
VSGESNFPNLKFLNFRGTRNGRKFAVSPSPVFTASQTDRLTDSRLMALLAVLPSCRLAVYDRVCIAFGVEVRSVSYADQVPTGGIARERARDVA